MEICVDEEKLKEIIKQAIAEMFEDHKQIIYEIFSEVIQDIALAHAIREGETTGGVSKAEILNIFRDQP